MPTLDPHRTQADLDFVPPLRRRWADALFPASREAERGDRRAPLRESSPCGDDASGADK